mmetsp:Transcript_941/g.2877  ORF Transcript_941/g.2877 Transcript_941/m.2877 type:complete len:202 (+) Transcript_941:1057-1662(+)
MLPRPWCPPSLHCWPRGPCHPPRLPTPCRRAASRRSSRRPGGRSGAGGWPSWPRLWRPCGTRWPPCTPTWTASPGVLPRQPLRLLLSLAPVASLQAAAAWRMGWGTCWWRRRSRRPMPPPPPPCAPPCCWPTWPPTAAAPAGTSPHSRPPPCSGTCCPGRRQSCCQQQWPTGPRPHRWSGPPQLLPRRPQTPHPSSASCSW